MALADPRRPPPPAIVERMTTAVRHRGPDGRGLHAAPGVGLGVQRLAIVDLDTGRQPIENETGTVLVVCNGEIYNHVELRAALEARGHRFRSRSDVEVVAHLYEERGFETVDHLRGMFSFALWDADRRRLWLVRDRLGIKPLHYAVTPGALYFASEIKSMLAAEIDPGPTDVRALDAVFAFGFVFDPHTMFSGIRRLPPGHWLLYREGQTQVHQYWRLPAGRVASGEGPADTATAAARLRAKLEETVRLHLRADVPLGAWLSSGLDSSTVVALARRMTSPLPTFTLTFDEPEFDESRDRRTLDRVPGHEVPNERVRCDRSAFDRYPEALWHTETPSTHTSEIPRLLLAEAAARHVKVVLTGEGGDEVLGGYFWYLADRLLQPAAVLPYALRALLARTLLGPWGRELLLGRNDMGWPRYRRMVGPLDAAERHGLFSDDVRHQLRDAGPADSDGTPDAARPRDRFERLQQHDLGRRLPGYVTSTLDAATMAYGLEARVPFLDHELVELCAEIPSRLKVRRLHGKYVLRQAVADLLPQDIVWQRKRGLRAPMAAWLRGPLPAFADELLSSSRLRAAGYFEPGAVARLLERHRVDAASDGRLLLGVLSVQLWDELFRRVNARVGGPGLLPG
jgi:asparagine synthase (glutamine-hydrolysing)